MRQIALFATLLLAQPSEARAEGAVLVRTELPRRGTAAEVVVAYGQAVPSTKAARTLSLAQSGEVTAVRVTPGQAVSRGQPLLTFKTAPAGLAAHRQAVAALTLARAQRLHAAQLLAQQLATRDQLATADKAVADAAAQLSALAQEGAGLPSVTLTAPFNAVVSTTPVAAGERPAAGAPLVTLARASGLQVSVGVEPGRRARLRPGQRATLHPVEGGPALQAHVIRVDAVLNPRSRLVDVDLSAPRAALAGQTFRAEIETGTAAGWIVPHAAVRVEDGRAFLFQLDGGKARRVQVMVLQAGRDVDVLRGPLDPARPLVTVGAYQLDDGAAVRTR